MKKIYNSIIKGIQNYCVNTSCKGFVIGISGGKDSTVVAKLLVDAIGADKVLGILMPNGEQTDIKDSIKVCELLGINYHTVNINCIYNCLLSAIHEPDSSNVEMLYDEYGNMYPANEPKERIATTNDGFQFQISPKARTNIPPRLRMTVLYAIAQSIGYRVCGTGNKSEHYIGWFTKWGDGACDFNPIADLTCTEVIELGHYMGLPDDLVDKTPADGLTGKSDEENFGFTYKELDQYISDPSSVTVHNMDNYPKFDEMHKKSQHKTKVYELSLS